MCLPSETGPTPQFNFLVDLRATATPTSVDAGFQECSNLGMEVTVAEYRTGNAKENGVRRSRGSTRRPT